MRVFLIFESVKLVSQESFVEMQRMSEGQVELRREPRQERSKERFERMLDAAAALILERGSATLKMSEVAERAEVPIGSLYQYFPNKRAILAQLTERYLRMFQQEIADALKGIESLEDLRARLDRLIWDVYRQAREEPVFRDIWSGAEADPVLEEINMKDSRINGDAIYHTFLACGGDQTNPNKRNECFLICHLAGTAVRIAMSREEAEGDQLARIFIDMALDRLFREPMAGSTRN